MEPGWNGVESGIPAALTACPPGLRFASSRLLSAPWPHACRLTTTSVHSPGSAMCYRAAECDGSVMSISDPLQTGSGETVTLGHERANSRNQLFAKLRGIDKRIEPAN